MRGREVDGAGEGRGEAEVAEHEGHDSAFALAPYGVALGDCHVVGFQGRRIWLLGRLVDSEPGKAFVVNETGWGEFEIAIKLYYVPESGEKPQTLYHHLRLHPYGRTDAEKDAMRASGEVTAWTYEEQIFNEPYEVFYDVLTSGALPTTAAGANRGKGKGSAPAVGGVRTEGGVLERSAMIPLSNRPGQPFSRDTEQLEVERLKKAQEKAQALMSTLQTQLKNKEAALQKLRKQTASAK
ncbi:hypothetical protein MCOR18_003869 [Pyricularia oryzae]|nr:hypothetical protein MCOR18_003869 [Pyricularia oryzae]